MFNSATDLVVFINREAIDFVDIRFTDLLGTQHHFTMPAANFKDTPITDGIMFDASSLPGFKAIHESDMKLLPDVATAYIDPFRKSKTIAISASVVTPITNQAYTRDPRYVATQAENYLKSTGIADTCYVGAEAEFYLFDSIRYRISPERTFYEIDSRSAPWNADLKDSEGNPGHKMLFKSGYSPVSPMDHFSDVRDDISLLLEEVGLHVERAHHEVGAAAQQEINYRFAPLVRAADDMQKFKYVVKNEALNHGLSATFMPKPVLGDNGSGMHTHISLWQDGQPLFSDPSGYAGLSQTALWFIGGLLQHAPAMLAFTNPTINSFRRLIPGFEAPIALVYSAGNRSACVRIPITGTSPKAKRIEYRIPDGAANPYLAFAAILMAGLDGIENQIDPGDPMDVDLYEVPRKELERLTRLPHSLESAFRALDRDHEFLLKGNVFTDDLLEALVKFKYEREIDPVRTMPHPMEFQLYYGS